MMKNTYSGILLLFGIVLLNFSITAQNRLHELTLAENYLSSRPEVHLAVYPDNLKKAALLSKLISIDKIDGDTIFAYANAKQFNDFLKTNINFKSLIPPSLRHQASMSDNVKSAKDWDTYPTYEAYIAMMQQFEDDYPQLCKLENLGQSVNGRDILAVKISDNVFLKEPEPEFLYTSTMHGDELTGYVLSLRLIDYLLSNYGSNDQVTHLVNSLEIYVNPLSNPDGTYYMGNHTVNGSTRFNVNGVDLNRNFPDPEDGLHPDGNFWQQENVVMMGFLFSHNFVLSTNIHTGYEVVNYPWDTWQHHHAENDWYEYISREYADTVHAYKPPSLGNYLSAQNNGITNGFAWYTIDGGRQDYMNFYLNSRETTMELSYTKTPNASMLPLYWEANYRSVLNYMEHCLYGFTGKITEAGSGGVPVIAKVEVINHDFDNSHIYSHHANGQYFRLLLPGVYSLRFSAPGYKDVTLEDLTLMPGENPVYDVEMEINPESINEFGELKNDISVYPNPTNGLLHCAFNMKQPGKVSFVFYDHQGKVVQSNLGEFFIQGKQFREFNISSFKKGNYILLFIFDDFRYSIKINKE